MYSLFTRIFLSFWLVALLLGLSLFLAERYLGEDVVRHETERVEGHAATVSALLGDAGMGAVERWLAKRTRKEQAPLFLLDHQGELLHDHPLPPPLRERLAHLRLQPGTTTLRPGLVAIVTPIPNSEPPLYLGTVLRMNRIEIVPVWVRIMAAVLFSGLVTFVLAALITRPIRRLRLAAQALAEGDLSVRVPVHGRDEVAALGNDFNVMAARLRDLLEAQKRLLRDVSHELRSPLARLRVALELARKRGDTVSVIERIEREADRLEGMVSDVLALSRIEATASQPERRPVGMDTLIAAVVQDAAFEAEATHKSVMAELAQGVTVSGDPVLLRSAVENVMRNAVRYTAPQGAVSVALRSEQGEAVIVVRDHGTGVPEEELGKLFHPFSRVGEARDRASGGYGLGLAISRQAVESHGGTITAANAEGGGLVVTIRLPLTV
ncbi:MAG TPA: ATP-binding protein [Gammaproteobacteria bacterium]